MVDATAEVLTEVPDSLKRLVRYIMKGFYGAEHALVADMLMHYPCIKEDDLLDRLKFDRRQLRAIINAMKTDHFIKTRLRMETDAEGRMTKHNYYFLCYSVFVNVVKYKLDHMRRRIETEERDLTNRASFVCTECKKQFTDLEVGQLMDMSRGLLVCTFCEGEVRDGGDASGQATADAKGNSEDSGSSAVVTRDPRTRMIKFNEQIAPIYALLHDVEDKKLSAEILEPEPQDLRSSRGGTGRSGTAGDGSDKWSGDATRHDGISYLENQITVSTNELETNMRPSVPAKETPVWMSHSTVDGTVADSRSKAADRQVSQTRAESSTSGASRQNSDDIMRILLSHEKKPSQRQQLGGAWGPAGSGAPTASNEPSSTSDSDSDEPNNTQRSKPNSAISAHADHMASDDDDNDEDDDEGTADSNIMITVQGVSYPYHDITTEMVGLMSQAEKEEYIRIGQEMYEDLNA